MRHISSTITVIISSTTVVTTPAISVAFTITCTTATIPKISFTSIT